MTKDQCQAAAESRPDLCSYVESSRYAITWDDVAYYESIGKPYPLVSQPADAYKPVAESATLRSFKVLFGISAEEGS